MNSLYANIINETQKLFSKKKTIALLIISGIIPIGAAVVIGLLQSSSGISLVDSGRFPLQVLGVFTNLFMPLFVCMAAVDLFSGELGERTLKTVLLRPVTRLKVFISKLAAVGIYTALTMVGILVLSIVSGLFVQGKEDLLGGILSSVLAYIVAVLPMVALGIAASFIAQFFKSSSGALTISIFIYIASKIIATLFPQVSRLMITSFTNWHTLWIGSTLPAGKILGVFMFILSYSIIFFGAGYYFFEKKEL